MKTNIVKKLSTVFMNIGESHANSLSLAAGFYEPKISKNLLKKADKSKICK